MTYYTYTSPMERAMASDPVRDDEHAHLVDPADVGAVLRLGSVGSLSSVEQQYAQPEPVLPTTAVVLPENLRT